MMQDALRVQMMEFGRTPQQLFLKKHPKRRVLVTGGRPSICCFPPTTPRAVVRRPNTNLLRPTHQVRQGYGIEAQHGPFETVQLELVCFRTF